MRIAEKTRIMAGEVESLSDIHLIYELERLWATLTVVKTANNMLEEALGLRNGTKAIVVLTSNERLIEQASFHYPNCIIAHATSKDEFYNLSNYLNYKGNHLGGLILERLEDQKQSDFSHFCSKMRLNLRSDQFFLIIAPEAHWADFNPYFIAESEIKEGI